MNWLKIGAVVVGGIVVFFVLNSVVHLLLGLLTALAFVAIVAGGGYVAYKIWARGAAQVRATQEPDRAPGAARPRAVRPRAVVPRWLPSPRVTRTSKTSSRG